MFKNRYTLKTRSIVFLLVTLLLMMSTTVFARPGHSPTGQQSSLPQITFLGEGPQTFTIEPPLQFLVKTYQNGVFLFVPQEGPTYTARRSERVWTTNFVPAETIRLFDEERSYGNVEAGCVVNYVQIEDNVDTRRNTFFINGEPLQVVEQGMVTYGTFTVPESGELTFFAEDSIGMVIELCQTTVQTVVPSETPQETVTATGAPSLTATAETITSTPVITTTATEAITATTPTATASATLPATQIIIIASWTPTLTPTASLNNPTATPTPTASSNNPTATRTSTASASDPTSTPPAATATRPAGSTTPTATVAALLITATPIATPNAFPVTGGEPGPREIAAISRVLIGLLVLVAAAWWFLVRAYLQNR